MSGPSERCLIYIRAIASINNIVNDAVYARAAFTNLTLKCRSYIYIGLHGIIQSISEHPMDGSASRLYWVELNSAVISVHPP